jgi:hypothetical protein
MRDRASLLIPFADTRDGGSSISCEGLAELSEYDIAQMRNAAALARRRGEPPLFRCPECRGPLFSRGDRSGRRPHWSHFGSDRSPCPYDRRRLSPDAVSALIFRGRQEGEAHQNLRLLLFRLASSDPQTLPGSCSTDQYDRPEEGTGCYPDVIFEQAGKKRVLEVQLARISLASIATRRNHYSKQGADLIWVTRNFDQYAFKRMFQWDIIAAQSGTVYSIDDEVLQLIAVDNRLRFRQFKFDTMSNGWFSSIVLLTDIEAQPLPQAAIDVDWHVQFKRQWIELASNPNPDRVKAVLVPQLLEKLAMKPGDLPPDLNIHSLEVVVSTLLSIEQGRSIGHYKGNLTHMINYRSVATCNGRCVRLFHLAISRLQPDLLKKPSIRKHLDQALQKCRTAGVAPFDRHSVLGKLWLLLWPDQPFDRQGPASRT